mmetsp:Transcript_94598/g.267390  ORF Transcript_94598/g.267390 Transcript_94598/m.267390 type:complete len:237 (-) Transcript_94598:2-712(-)
MGPGAMETTRMPSWDHSAASVFVRESMPAFAAAACPWKGMALYCSVAEVEIMMAPEPSAEARRSHGRAAWAPWKVPRRSMSSTVAKAFGVMSSARDMKFPAALLTKTSILPHLWPTASAAAFMASGSRTSARTNIASGAPARRIASEASCSFASVLPQMATRAPRRAKARQMPRPMPLPPPETKSTLPCMRPGAKTASERAEGAGGTGMGSAAAGAAGAEWVRQLLEGCPALEPNS